MGAVTRIQQGIRALLAFARRVDYNLAATYLDDRQLHLFKQMGRSDQLHSVNVLRMLLADPQPVTADLAAAALLHDVGKSRYPLSVLQKTIVVLVEAFLPRISITLATEESLVFWRAPFVVREWHPKWSAELLTEAGSQPDVIWLVRHHAENPDLWHDHPLYENLRRLQEADNEN